MSEDISSWRSLFAGDVYEPAAQDGGVFRSSEHSEIQNK